MSTPQCYHATTHTVNHTAKDSLYALRYMDDGEQTLAETIGDRIRRFRKARGLSLGQLAVAVGVAEGSIRKLESGNSGAPSFPNGLIMAEALGVDPWELAFGKPRASSPAGAERSDRLEALAKRVDRLAAELQTLAEVVHGRLKEAPSQQGEPQSRPQ